MNFMKILAKIKVLARIALKFGSMIAIGALALYLTRRMVYFVHEKAYDMKKEIKILSPMVEKVKTNKILEKMTYWEALPVEKKEVAYITKKRLMEIANRALVNVSVVDVKEFSFTEMERSDIRGTRKYKVIISGGFYSDEHVFSFLENLKNSAGIVDVKEMNIVKEKSPTKNDLYLVSAGVKTSFITARMKFNWYIFE